MKYSFLYTLVALKEQTEMATEYMIDQEKKSIVLDDKINTLAQSFVSNICELDSTSHVDLSRTKQICTLSHMLSPFCEGDILTKLQWISDDVKDALSLDQRMELEYDNNLDSVAEYTSDKFVCADTSIIFALLECVRKGLHSDKAYFICKDTDSDIDKINTTDVYM